MYGSSLITDTLKFLDSRIDPKDAATIPFPRDDTTPPVINMYFVTLIKKVIQDGNIFYQILVNSTIYEKKINNFQKKNIHVR